MVACFFLGAAFSSPLSSPLFPLLLSFTIISPPRFVSCLYPLVSSQYYDSVSCLSSHIHAAHMLIMALWPTPSASHCPAKRAPFVITHRFLSPVSSLIALFLIVPPFSISHLPSPPPPHAIQSCMVTGR
ncbi:hypothetical protein BJV74DRAFT_346891 [Russula compacta]|nr:hypothetical protein BJV74DRAFT_346891 [Russula compacta]